MIVRSLSVSVSIFLAFKQTRFIKNVKRKADDLTELCRSILRTDLSDKNGLLFHWIQGLELLQSCIPKSPDSSKTQTVWDSSTQSDGVRSSRSWDHWQGGPFHTHQISSPPKDTHQGTRLCPMASLAATTPCQHIVWHVYVYAALPPPSPCLQGLHVLPQPSASASSLTCLLRKPLLTCLPTNNIQGDKGIKASECLLLQPQLTLCDMFSQKTEGLPVARIQKSDLSSQAAAACLDLRLRVRWIPVLFLLFF